MSLTGDELDRPGDESTTPSPAPNEQYGEPGDSQDAYIGPDFEVPIRAGPEPYAADGDAYHPSEDDDRENTFHGPSSTWRSYAHNERQLAATLDQERANNLSIHLYNAHALKARHCVRDAETLKPWSSKRKWLRPDDSGAIPWHPDPNWTAWPLPPHEVPRRGEDLGAPVHEPEDGTYRKVEPWTPSSDLSVELYALMLRRAKTRFRGREWIKERPSAIEQAEAAATSPHDGGKADLATCLRERFPVQDSEPVFLADEDTATSLLRPSVRHVLTRLDNLLIGLHKSRCSHHDRSVVSRSRSRGPSQLKVSRSNMSEERSKSVGRSSRKASTVPPEHSGSEYEDQTSDPGIDDANSPPIRSARERERPVVSDSRPLGLRDWSEVLGMASLTGWDQDIVDRAARRCASLFKESMTFRTMPEMGKDKLTSYIPEMVPLESDSEVDAELSSSGEPALKGLFCPYESCSRHHQIYEKLWRWREHLKRGHKLDAKEIEDIEESLRKQAGSSAQMFPDSLSESDQDVHSQHELQGADLSSDEILRPIVFVRKDGKPRRRKSTFEERNLKKARLAHEEMADKPEKGFTDRETLIMAKAWLCMSEQPKIDYDKLAQECGMTNPRSASNAWAAIKKKLLAMAGGSGENGAEAAATAAAAAAPKSTPGKKRGKKAADHVDGDGDEEGASPTKKQKTPAKGGRGKKGRKDEEKGVEGRESPVKKEEVEGEDVFD
ncbi:RNA polymerase I specific transcription initiation factor [Teratosphaeria destructans]|uniref:RNA polymerase I specific transcription initiation factor n=1 Tax=Teratosphaeria destructans TaxID=418781 RepID=A0A9W7SM52_9PEZI|nr:RNA polymerase I specific transcription initiation factor [Teratosphaeria destructans]